MDAMPKLHSHIPDLTAAEIITSYDDFIRWAEDRASAAEAQAELARAEVAKLQTEREVLVTALERAEVHRRGPTLTRPALKTILLPVAEGDRWDILSRADAVQRVLVEADEPLSPKAISERLGQRGREGDRPELVSAVLNYLRKGGRAHAPTHGVWRAGKAPGPADVFSQLQHPADSFVGQAVREGLTLDPDDDKMEAFLNGS
jgi:hypothetical protein